MNPDVKFEVWQEFRTPVKAGYVVHVVYLGVTYCRSRAQSTALIVQELTGRRTDADIPQEHEVDAESISRERRGSTELHTVKIDQQSDDVGQSGAGR